MVTIFGFKSEVSETRLVQGSCEFGTPSKYEDKAYVLLKAPQEVNMFRSKRKTVGAEYTT